MISDKEIINTLKIDNMILNKFKQTQKLALEEAKKLKSNFYNKKIRILGISGATRREEDCPHEDSNSEFLLKKALDECQKLGAEVKLLRLWDKNIMPCKGCYSTTNTQCHYKCSCYPEGTDYADDMTKTLYDDVIWADGIIFSTPTHNFKISSILSLWIDRAISLDGSLKPADETRAKNKEINIKHTKFIEMTADDNLFGSGFLHRFTGKVAGIIATGHEAGLSMAISSLYMTLNHFGMVFPPFSNCYITGDVCKGLYSDREHHRAECSVNEAKKVATNVYLMIKELKSTKGQSFKKDSWWRFNAGSN